MLADSIKSEVLAVMLPAITTAEAVTMVVPVIAPVTFTLDARLIGPVELIPLVTLASASMLTEPP
ncbi:hypothetical protein AKG95_25145 [Janthinobacterium lividum]|uniref:Uncharacterized protein n=1 Tax=Janthinobacterium lividum TaxID=29581 RepID=A0A1S1U1C3_9BURK|nr:hypothetical protein AKG95_25145 [Janthinobacterium lividum]